MCTTIPGSPTSLGGQPFLLKLPVLLRFLFGRETVDPELLLLCSSCMSLDDGEGTGVLNLSQVLESPSLTWSLNSFWGLFPEPCLCRAGHCCIWGFSNPVPYLLGLPAGRGAFGSPTPPSLFLFPKSGIHSTTEAFLHLRWSWGWGREVDRWTWSLCQGLLVCWGTKTSAEKAGRGHQGAPRGSSISFSHQPCSEGSSFSTSLPTLVTVCFLCFSMIAAPVAVKCYRTLVLVCISPMTNGCRASFPVRVGRLWSQGVWSEQTRGWSCH